MVRSKECGIAFSKLPMRQSTSKTIGSKVALLSKLPIRQSTITLPDFLIRQISKLPIRQSTDRAS